MPRGVLANVSAHARTLNHPPTIVDTVVKVIVVDVVNIVVDDVGEEEDEEEREILVHAKGGPR